MASENKGTRRNALIATGIAGLGLLGASTTQAQQKEGKHPRLRMAVVEMRAARKYLEDAPDNFGGHKKKAIEALDAAIEQIEEALKTANKK